MNGSKLSFRRNTKAVAGALVGVALLFLASCLWAGPEQAACLFYGAAASLFLVAQIVAFILSQVRYSESVERIKFDVLEKERAEWDR